MKTSRRTFLRAAGVGLSLPVLESFGSAPSKASPKRMIAINQDLGFIPKLFFPEQIHFNLIICINEGNFKM